MPHYLPISRKMHKIFTKVCKFFFSSYNRGLWSCTGIISNFQEYILKFLASRWVFFLEAPTQPQLARAWSSPAASPSTSQTTQVCLHFPVFKGQKLSFLRFSGRPYWSLQSWRILFSNKVCVQLRRYIKLFRIIFLTHT